MPLISSRAIGHNKLRIYSLVVLFGKKSIDNAHPYSRPLLAPTLLLLSS